MSRKFVSLITFWTLMTLAGCASFEKTVPVYKPSDELVVLAHGLGRSDWSMRKLEEQLETAGYKVCSLDYPTIGESVDSVLSETRYQIDACIVSAPKVHFVGHSLGGLVIRAYLQEHKTTIEPARMGKVVLMGTPNKGSELADHFSDSWLMKVGGGISHALMTGNNSLGNTLEEINLSIGVIAGTKSSSLTSERFDGLNDGLVSVESAKLKNMSDFVMIDVNHTQMRSSPEVIEQTIHFLQYGRFRH
ncbi:MAG: alpha/beta fold hydrolase [Marinomonas sp.]